MSLYRIDSSSVKIAKAPSDKGRAALVAWRLRDNRYLTLAILAGVFLFNALSPSVRAESPATRSATQPSTAPIQFDDALVKARDTRGPELTKLLAPFASRFQMVDVTEMPGRNRWDIRTLNKHGKGFDALRFKVPQGSKTHLYWAFSCPNVEEWYIIPTGGALTGFEQFFPANGVKYRLPPRMNRNLILQELPTRLEPGKEYLLWFKLKGNQPVTMSLSIVLLNDQRKGESQDVEWAIGLERAD